MNANNSIYVLDTSAWLTLIEDEVGADVVQDILERATTGSVEIIVPKTCIQLF